MTVQQWIEVAGLIMAGAGGGKMGVGIITKLTRLVVAVETLTAKLDTLATSHANTVQTVQNHEVRLAKGGL